MRILITDSGVGGLSVVAYAERFVRENGAKEPVSLIFANAAPANDYGYNSMPTKEEKIETFDRFLRSVASRYSPDAIYVACNSLSVLLPETPFHQKGSVPVQGIVATGAELILRAMEDQPHSTAIIFATPTTIESDAYTRALESAGIESERIVAQACPDLASVISEDRKGSRVREEIDRWVGTALERVPRREAPIVAALACTHYGYRKSIFADAFSRSGLDARIVNPNEDAIRDIFPPETRGDSRETEVEFVTRYPIPPATIDTLTFFLEDVSPKTVEAMRRFQHIPELF